MDALALARLLRQMPKQGDYDVEGYYQKHPSPYKSLEDMQMSKMMTGSHYNDEFKTPEHITFSTGSVYSQPDIQGGQWQSGGTDRWQFTPSEQNLRNTPAGALGDYFRNYENKNTFVRLPDGTYVEGNR